MRISVANYSNLMAIFKLLNHEKFHYSSIKFKLFVINIDKIMEIIINFLTDILWYLYQINSNLLI